MLTTSNPNNWHCDETHTIASGQDWYFGAMEKGHMKNLLRGCNAKLGREDILNPTLGMRIYIKIIMIMVLEY